MIYVSYLRLSKESKSGRNYGLTAQRRDLDLFLGPLCPDVEDGCAEIAEYREIQSGADDNRPVLAKAIAHCSRVRATLLVSRLDRLSRKVSFIAKLLETKDLEFRVASMPHASKFELHIYAALAEQEREFISLRTRAGLAAARDRGSVLGGLRPGTVERNLASIAKADARAKELQPLIERFLKEGRSAEFIADVLTDLGNRTSRGTPISGNQVRRWIQRLAPVGDQIAG